MFYLIVTILLNVLISSIFKVFPKYKIDALQAIVVNYVVCVVTGSLFIGYIPYSGTVINSSWFLWSMLMGVGFFAVFNLIAYCTKVDGITTAVIANKLSLVIPVLFSIIVFKEQAGIEKIAGILLAFPAIFFITRVSGANNKPQSLMIPALLFVGGGLLDTLMNFVQLNFLNSTESQALYTIYCFTFAGIIGILLITVLLLTKKTVFSFKNVVAGICIGVPNYFSIYCFILMLHSPFLQSSASIPVLNIGILIASAITAILFFREKANMMRIIGLALSVISILLIMNFRF